MTEYAKMVDDMCEVLTNSNVCTNYGHDTVPALLLMDDITLMADSAVQLQHMLDIIHNQAMNYHVRFGEDKCKVMLVGDNDSNMFGWQLGNTKLGVCTRTSYTYLGETITSDFTMLKHLENKGREAKAALSTLRAVTSDEILDE